MVVRVSDDNDVILLPEIELIDIGRRVECIDLERSREGEGVLRDLSAVAFPKTNL